MLPPRLINESSRAKDCPAAKILNTSIAHSRYPSRWKMGQVMPLFKRDEELDKRNVLPVLPCLNNILKDCSRIKCRISTKVDCQTSFQLIDDVTVARPRLILKLTKDWRVCRDMKELAAVVSFYRCVESSRYDSTSSSTCEIESLRSS